MSEKYKEITLKHGEEENELSVGRFKVIRPCCGKIEYFVDGEYHRLDGPALIGKGKYEEWYHYDKLHRIDGPAHIDGPEKAYYLNGVKMSYNDWRRERKHWAEKQLNENIKGMVV